VVCNEELGYEFVREAFQTFGTSYNRSIDKENEELMKNVRLLIWKLFCLIWRIWLQKRKNITVRRVTVKMISKMMVKSKVLLWLAFGTRIEYL